MATLFIPLGIPGSGKSTWTAAHLPHAQTVATDAIRRELAGSLLDAWATPQRADEINRQVFAAYYERIAALLAAGHDVIADATNLYSSARTQLRDIAAAAGAGTHLLLFSDLAGAQLRNVTRVPDAIVPPSSMAKMLSQFSAAMNDLAGECYGAATEIGVLPAAA
jgi:predicted kinase